MALTLVEAAKAALGRDEVLKASVMELFARSSDILQYMPFEDITGNALSFNRERTLPGIAFRGVNAAYTESTGQLDKVTESLAIGGGDLDVDVFLVKTTGTDQRGIQEAMKIKALSLNITKEIIKGDVTTDPKGFDGLQVRCTGDQKIAIATGATDPITLVKLDELIDAVDEPTHLLCSKSHRRRLSAAARSSTIGGYITYELDAFGRRVTKYNDIPLLIVDKDNTDTDILPFTETDPQGGSIGSSIYCVSFNETGVIGLQNGEMDVRDLGEIDTQPVMRTRIEWYLTLAIMRPKAAARLWGIVDNPARAA